VTAAETLGEAARQLKLEAAIAFENLSVVPLVSPAEREAGYVTLDEALAAGHVSITEVDEAGRVPELKIVNSAATPVLLLDGEELLGAKQNRVVNLSILVPARRTTVIPVSCVESGRWRHVSRRFASAPQTQFAEGRAAKMQQVTRSMQTAGQRTADQGAVWSLIAEKSGRLGAISGTSAMSAMFDKLDRPLDAFVSAFPPVKRQVGAVFFINGGPAGLECFDAPSVWRALSPKLIRSYALDAIDRSDSHGPEAVDASAFVARVAGSTSAAFPAVGEGEDLRLSGDHVVGAALVADGRLIHLSAFPQHG
jgi:hypothetical protein